MERPEQLVAAAIAANDAVDLDAGFSVVLDAAVELVSADHAWVIVWDEALERGVVRAVTGENRAVVGAVLGSGDNLPYRAVTRGEPIVTTGVAAGGMPPELAAFVSRFAMRVSVPVIHAGAAALSFQAGWFRTLPEEELETASVTLRNLGALTGVVHRTHEERRRARERARLAAVLDAVPDGILFHARQRVVANPAAQEMLGLEDDVFPDPDVFRLRTLDGRPLERHELPFEVARTTGVAHRFRYRATSLRGKELVVDGQIGLIRDAAGAIDGSVTVLRDVSEEYERAHLSEELQRELFEALPTAVLVLNARTGEIASVNQAFVEFVGYARDEVLHRRPPFPWSTGDDAESPRHRGAFEGLFRRRDGSLVPVETAGTTIRGSTGDVEVVVILVTDLSERRRLQEQLVQSGKLAAVGELAAGVAHEINNPLFAILGLTEFLLREIEEGTRAHERLELIHGSGIEIREIVRALLDFARERSDELSLIRLEDVVRQALDLVRRTHAVKGVQIVDRYDAPDAILRASANQLKQVLLNLIANARYALPDGGVITVEVGAGDGWGMLSVADDGPGIDPEVLPRIFEPFYTTRRGTGGTGLGLPVSLGIVEAHGGTLTVESGSAGTTFVARLPLEQGLE